MNSEIECGKCGEICIVDGEGCKVWAWCENCRDYAKDFDSEAYVTDKFAAIADEAKDRKKYGDLE